MIKTGLGHKDQDLSSWTAYGVVEMANRQDDTVINKIPDRDEN